jgi:hypothetical protein
VRGLNGDGSQLGKTKQAPKSWPALVFAIIGLTGLGVIVFPLITFHFVREAKRAAHSVDEYDLVIAKLSQILAWVGIGVGVISLGWAIVRYFLA